MPLAKREAFYFYILFKLPRLVMLGIALYFVE